MKKYLIYTLYILILYFSIHNFPLFGIGTKSIGYVITLILLVSCYKEYIALLKSFKMELCLLLLILAYSILRTIAGGEMAMLSKHVVAFFDMLLTPLSLLLFSLKVGIKDENRAIRCLLVLGCVASLISLLAFIFPSVQSYIKYTILNLQPDDALYWNNYRGFGLSANLSSSYAYIQGCLFVFGCCYFQNNKWILIFLPIIFLSTFANARTGVIILLTGVFLLLFSKKFFKESIMVGLLGLLFLLYMPDILKGLGASNNAIEWMYGVFYDTENVILSQDITSSRTGDVLFGRMWVLPNDDNEWLYGKGYSLHRHLVDDTSDIGWILHLNYGGIIYMIVLYLLIFYMYFRIYKIRRRFFAFFFILIFFIVNTKTSFLPNSDVFRMLMLMYMYFMILDKHVNNRLLKSAKRHG